MLAIASLGFLYQQLNSSQDSVSEDQLIAIQNDVELVEVFENQAVEAVEQTDSSQRPVQTATTPPE